MELRSIGKYVGRGYVTFFNFLARSKQIRVMHNDISHEEESRVSFGKGVILNLVSFKRESFLCTKILHDRQVTIS